MSPSVGSPFARRVIVCALQAKRWIETIAQVLEAGHLSPGAASKLAGKLAWGSAHLFNRLGRAMLRPLFDQKSRRDGQVDFELHAALRWWKDVLSRGVPSLLRAVTEVCDSFQVSGIAEGRSWAPPAGRISHLFCDARGHPPHIAAVLFQNGKCTFTHMTPSAAVLEMFRCRMDSQTMGLELLSISLGLESFKRELHGQKVIVHSDNTGSEV